MPAAPVLGQRPSRFTGERPRPGSTPDSLLALHDAGYRAVAERLGPGRVLDVGCGEGFESVRLGGPDRVLVGVDHDSAALVAAAKTTAAKTAAASMHVAASDAACLALGTACFDWVCSSHLVEHFTDPRPHLAEMARVLAPDGSAFVLTPNAPADFENPFHLTRFVPDSLRSAMSAHFGDVWVGGLEGSAAVKDDFARRRRRGALLLSLDVLGLRHRLPRSWYVAAYTRLLPLAYRLVARGERGGETGITADDFFVTDHVDDTTPVLLAVGRRPLVAIPPTGTGERA